MIKIFVINGRGGVGKDTFVELFRKVNPQAKVKNISTVDYVKECAYALGWRGTKEKEDRRFLSDLKDALTHWHDIPFQETVRKVKEEIAITNSNEDLFVFIHSREPEDIERLCKTLGAKAILIESTRVQDKLGNHADDNVELYYYNYYIKNNGTLEEFEDRVKDFSELIKEEGN